MDSLSFIKTSIDYSPTLQPGMVSKYVGVKVLCVETNSVINYPSLKAASRALKVDRNIIRQRLRDKSLKPYFSKYVFMNCDVK